MAPWHLLRPTGCPGRPSDALWLRALAQSPDRAVATSVHTSRRRCFASSAAAVFNAAFKASAAEHCKIIDSETASESIWAEIFLHFYATNDIGPIMAAVEKGKAAGVEDLKHEPGLCENFSPNILEGIQFNVAVYRAHIQGVRTGWQNP